MVLVLLVDDDSTRLAMNADALLAAGHQVCTAVTRQEALEELSWNAPDAVVCEFSGRPEWELVRHAREDERYGGIPIVLIGEADDKDVRLEAFRRGVDDYLPRPFDPEELVQRLDRVLGRSRMVERPVTLPPSCDVQGRLENFPLASVLRLLATEKKTGVLLLHHRGERMRIVFSDGCMLRVEAHQTPEASWHQNLLAALSWASGDFWFSEQPVQGPDDIGSGVDELLTGALYAARFGRRA